MIEPNLKRFSQAIEESEPIKMSGKIVQVIGLVIESKGPNVSMGELCYIKSRFPGVEPIPAISPTGIKRTLPSRKPTTSAGIGSTPGNLDFI